MNKSSKFITAINYLFIYLVINYQLVVDYIILIDSAGYLLLLLSLVILILNSKQIASIQSTKPVKFWLFWCIYVTLNYYFHPFHSNELSILQIVRFVLYPLLTMTITVKEYKDNPVGLIKISAVALLSYALIGAYFETGVLYRRMDMESVLGNTYAIITSCSLFYLCLLQRTRRINMVLFVALTIIIFVVLAMSGTRKAFFGGGIMICFWILSMVNIKSVKTWLLTIVLAVCVLWGYDVLMEKTILGQRMEIYEEQQNNNLPIDAPEFLKIFGDRSYHYYYGWKQFVANPIFGLGLFQSQVDNRSGSRSYYLHTEYIAQLSDNGIIGFALFFMMYYWIGNNLLKRLKVDKRIGMIMIGGFAVLLFLNLTAWSWSFPHYFICLGVLIGYCQSEYELEIVRVYHRG